MTTEPRLLGAVLAGGKSRRYGRDKAAELVAGEPLASRAARTLSRVFEEVVIVSSASPSSVDPWRRIPDVRVGCGPLGGLEAALELAEAESWEGVFLLACDLPLVTADIVRSVASKLGAADAAAARRPGAPAHEPLCAAYRCTCLDLVRSLLDEGELAIHELASRVSTVFVEVAAEAVLNVNTPADRERAESVLRSRGP